MHWIKRCFATALIALALPMMPSTGAAEQLVASSSSRMVYLNPLRNGLSAVTLVYPMQSTSLDQVFAMTAGLKSVLSGGTAQLTPFEALTFLQVNGIRFDVTSEQSNMLLTMTAPAENFSKALRHLDALLSNPRFPQGWYRRELARIQPVLVRKNKRPDSVIAALARALHYPVLEGAQDSATQSFRFGKPQQAIVRSGNEEDKKQLEAFLRALPERKRSLFSLFANLGSNRPFTLPRGMIHIEDAGSSEMLILLVKARQFEDEEEQIAANLLMNYMGAHQGSEMFRIIRQELRAAYSPKSHFNAMGKNRALMGLSATVAAQEWPEIYERMRKIYTDTQAGEISASGLETVHKRLIRGFEQFFATNAVWGAQQYLREYPRGATGTITLPLFQALGRADPAAVRQSANAALPPLEDYLVILLGSGPAPSAALKAQGYCALPRTQALRYCLDKLAAAQQQ